MVENVGLNKVANSLWIGKKLFPQHIISINSFLQNGFQYNLYVYDEVKNIPSGVNVCDGNDLLPDSAIWYYGKGFNKGSPSGFSNEFRFTLLNTLGGLWVDTDVILLKDFNLDKPYIFISERNVNNDVHPTSSVIYSDSGNSGKIWLEAIDNLIDGTQLPEDVIGLHLFDAQSNLNDIDKKTYSHNSIIEQLKRKYL